MNFFFLNKKEKCLKIDPCSAHNNWKDTILFYEIFLNVYDAKKICNIIFV